MTRDCEGWALPRSAPNVTPYVEPCVFFLFCFLVRHCLLHRAAYEQAQYDLGNPQKVGYLEKQSTAGLGGEVCLWCFFFRFLLSTTRRAFLLWQNMRLKNTRMFDLVVIPRTWPTMDDLMW
jgi:hypothetical protein